MFGCTCRCGQSVEEKKKGKSCNSAADTLKMEDVHVICHHWLDYITDLSASIARGDFAHEHKFQIWPASDLVTFSCFFFFLCVFSEVIHDGRWTARSVLCEEDCSPIFSHSLVKFFGGAPTVALWIWTSVYAVKLGDVHLCGLSVLVCRCHWTAILLFKLQEMILHYSQGCSSIAFYFDIVWFIVFCCCCFFEYDWWHFSPRRRNDYSCEFDIYHVYMLIRITDLDNDSIKVFTWFTVTWFPR